jgi:hypothetical protein
MQALTKGRRCVKEVVTFYNRQIAVSSEAVLWELETIMYAFL